MFGTHAKELIAAAVAIAAGAVLYKRIKGHASPPSPVPAQPIPAPPPAPAPAPSNYDPGTLTGPNSGDVNGLPTYNPAGSVQTIDTSAMAGDLVDTSYLDASMAALGILGG